MSGSTARGRRLDALPERMLSIPEIAERTGWNKQLLYDLIHQGKLPAYRLGSRIRVAEADLLALIEPVEHSRPEAD